MTSPESFVPLTAAAAPSAPREFRVVVLNGHDHGPDAAAPSQPAGFQSLESQRPAAFNSTDAVGKKIGEPRVTVQRDGDRITHLRIQCTCGQVMDLACMYDAPPPPAAAPAAG